MYMVYTYATPRYSNACGPYNSLPMSLYLLARSTHVSYAPSDAYMAYSYTY